MVNEKETRKLIKEEKEKLSLAYKQAQDSAQHHDSLVWTVSSIFTGSSLIMLGTIVASFYNISSFTLVMACIIGFFISLLNIVFVNDFNRIKNRRYDQCKEIEEKLNLVKLGGAIHKSGSGASGNQRVWYFSFLAILMFVWVMLIILKCCGL